MRTILIADDNKEWLSILSAAIRQEPSLQLVTAASTGREAIQYIQQHQPEIIVLDIIMPEFDGIFIVNFIKEKMTDYRPIIYMLSGIGTDSIIKSLNELNVDFFNIKPVDVRTVMTNLKRLSGQPDPQSISATATPIDKTTPVLAPSLEKQALSLLRNLDAPLHHLSSKYIVDALILCMENNNFLQMLTKSLYPRIAEKNDTTAAAVERNIRYTIQKMQKSNSPFFQNLFADCDIEKISNGQFLSTLVYHLKN